MYLVICNNTKQNFSGESEKINVKFHKMTTYTWNFQKHQEYFLTQPYVCHENIHSHHSGQGRNKTITLYKSWTYHQHFPSALWYTIQIKTWRLHKWQERKNQKIRGISLMLNEINFFKVNPCGIQQNCHISTVQMATLIFSPTRRTIWDKIISG